VKYHKERKLQHWQKKKEKVYQKKFTRRRGDEGAGVVELGAATAVSGDRAVRSTEGNPGKKRPGAKFFRTRGVHAVLNAMGARAHKKEKKICPGKRGIDAGEGRTGN